MKAAKPKAGRTVKAGKAGKADGAVAKRPGGGVRFTPESAREMAARSHAARKANAAAISSMREWAKAFRDVPSPDDPSLPMGAAVIRAMYLKAIGAADEPADVRAAQFLADLMGETESAVSLKVLPRLLDDV